MLCPATGADHRLFWMRSAWWCHDCRQKIESCCEGGGCPSIAEVALAGPRNSDRLSDVTGSVRGGGRGRARDAGAAFGELLDERRAPR